MPVNTRFMFVENDGHVPLIVSVFGSSNIQHLRYQRILLILLGRTGHGHDDCVRITVYD